MNKSTQRAATVAGLGAAALYALYRWQPQRISLFRPSVPSNIEPVDPNSDRLFSANASVAIVIAHPDDAEFFMGGTLARLAEHGARIGLILTTDGDKGYYPGQDAEKNREVRRHEQVAAAKLYGCENITFLEHPDGRLRCDYKLIREIRNALREFDAEYVITFDHKFFPRVQHSDHLATGEAANDAAKHLAGVQWILKFATRAPNFSVDISDKWTDKMALLEAHASQFHGRRNDFVKNFLRSIAEENGAAAGVSLAETFRAVRPKLAHRV